MASEVSRAHRKLEAGKEELSQSSKGGVLIDLYASLIFAQAMSLKVLRVLTPRRRKPTNARFEK